MVTNTTMPIHTLTTSPLLNSRNKWPSTNSIGTSRVKLKSGRDSRKRKFKSFSGKSRKSSRMLQTSLRNFKKMPTKNAISLIQRRKTSKDKNRSWVRTSRETKTKERMGCALFFLRTRQCASCVRKQSPTPFQKSSAAPKTADESTTKSVCSSTWLLNTSFRRETTPPFSLCVNTAS